MRRMKQRSARSEKLMRAYLLMVAALLVPIALSYGIAPAILLPKVLDIAVAGADQTQIFRALMCLYLAASMFWTIAAFKPAWQRVAVIWAVFFAFSLAIGRTISLIVDGPASRLLDVYLGLEIVGGLLGLAVLAYAREPDDELSDDVGEELVLDAGYLVLEVELLLLEPLELERVGPAGLLERVDGAVEVAMLLLEPEQRRPELANLLALHRTSPAP